MRKLKNAGSRVLFVSCAVVLGLVGQALVPGPPDSPKIARLATGGIADASELGFDPQRSVVVESLTTPTRLVFEDPSGSRTAVVSGGPVRSQDEDGNWNPIDLSLVKDPSGVLHPVNGSVPVSVFPSVTTSGEIAQLSIAGQSLALMIDGVDAGAKGTISEAKSFDPPQLPGMSKSDSAKATKLIGLPKPSSGAPVYPVSDGVSVEVAASVNGIKTTYSVDHPKAANGLTKSPLIERIRLPQGWSARQGSRAIELVDSSGVTQSWWLGGPVSDAAGPPALSYASMHLLGVVDGVVSGEVVLDGSWLSDSSRVFPITIDPGVVKTPLECCGGDTTIDSGGGIAWDSPEILIGYNPHDQRTYRGLITFNLSDFAGFDVAAGHLYLYQHSAVVCTPMPFSVSRNVTPWSTETIWPGPSTTDEFKTSVSSAFGPGCPAGEGGYVGLDITPMSSRWITDGAQNYGVTLAAGNESDHAYWKRFSSWEGGAAPLLFLSLGHRPGQAAPQWPSDGKVLASTTPRLTTNRAGDADNEDPYYRFQITKGADANSEMVADSGWIPDPAFDVPSGVLVDGNTYFWRVFTADLKPRFDWMTDEDYRQHLWNNPVFVTTPNWAWHFSIDLTNGDITPNPNPTAPKPERFGLPDTSGYASDPVETSSGNFVLNETELAFSDEIFGLGFARTYNARDVLSSSLGQGWSGSYQSRLHKQDDGSVILREDSGRQRTFALNPEGSFVRPPEADFDLYKGPDGTYRVVSDDDATARFDASGALAGYENSDGQSVSIERNPDKTIAKVVSSTGLSIGFTYNANKRLTKITSSDGRTVSYGYSSNRLTSVTDSNNETTTYEHDAFGRILSITDGSGVRIVTNTYDDLARVIYQEGPNGSKTRLDYDLVNFITTVTDLVSQSKTIYHHDSTGRLIKVTDAYGQSLTRTFDASGNLIGVVNRLGESLQQVFDVFGNVLSQTSPGGITEHFSYDQENRMTSSIDGLGAKTTYDYDSNERVPTKITQANGAISYFVVVDGLVVESIDGDGVKISYGYDQYRNMVSSSDAAGATTRYVYDRMGNQIELITPLGNRTVTTYDNDGNITSETNANGETTTYEYDKSGRLIKTIDPSGELSSSTYDIAGRVSTEVNANGEITSYVYDGFDNVSEIHHPSGAIERFTYDSLGRLLKSSDALGNVTTYSYDANGNQLSITDPSGSTTSKKLDYRGREIESSDGLGRVTRYEYDALDRIIKTTDPTAASSQTIYDSVGNVTEVIDGIGARSISRYSPANRLIETIDANGNTTRFIYNNLGQQVEVIDPMGNKTTSAYDLDSNLISSTSASGLVTSYLYDKAARQIGTIDPRGGLTKTVYSKRGEVIAEHDPTGAIKRFEYDPVGNLIKVVDQNGGVASFEYDKSSNRIAMIDQRGRRYSYGFDLANRMISSTDPLARVTTFDYDATSRLIKTTHPTRRSETNTFDKAGQVIAQILVDPSSVDGPSTATHEFSYDASGRRTSMKGTEGTTTYSYDQVGNLVSTTSPDNRTTKSTYDLVGNKTAMTYPDGTVLNFTYDKNNSLISISNSIGGTSTFALDKEGRLIHEALGDGTYRSYEYTKDLMTTFTQSTNNPKKPDITKLSHDANGRVVSEATPNGSTTYSYDKAGQLIKVGGNRNDDEDKEDNKQNAHIFL